MTSDCIHARIMSSKVITIHANTLIGTNLHITESNNLIRADSLPIKDKTLYKSEYSSWL